MSETPPKRTTGSAPWPYALEELVARLRYRPGWRFTLQEESHSSGEAYGLVFAAYSKGFDTYHPERGETYGVIHSFIVPPATFDERAWERWLLDRLIEVEQHECCEFFRFEEPCPRDTDGDGDCGRPQCPHCHGSGPRERRPFAPNHGPGRNPYSIIETGTVTDAETRFTGEHKPGSQP